MILPKIYYINLAHRTDRNKHFLEQMEKAGYPLDRTCRIDAIFLPENGALGCTRSQVKAVKTAIADAENMPFFIAEDDLELLHPETFIEDMKYMLESAMQWDVCMFSHSFNTVHKDIGDPKVRKLIRGHTASAYMVHPAYAEKLLANFEDCEVKQSSGKRRVCVDTYWEPLQLHDNWYVYVPRVIKQMASYSDIEKKLVNYKC